MVYRALELERTSCSSIIEDIVRFSHTDSIW